MLLSVKPSRQEYWSKLPYPSLGDLPHPGIKPTSPVALASQMDSLLVTKQESPDNSVVDNIKKKKSKTRHGGEWIHIYVWLSPFAETITTLWTGYTPVQNKQFKVWGGGKKEQTDQSYYPRQFLKIRERQLSLGSSKKLKRKLKQVTDWKKTSATRSIEKGPISRGC